MPQNPHVLLISDKVHSPLRLACKTTSERPKVLRNVSFLTLLTSKCASRHNRVQFFDITTSSTSKSGPNMVCFVQYILTSKWASHHIGEHFFDIATFKSAPKLRCLYILTWKCASRHNGVHLFDISTSAGSNTYGSGLKWSISESVYNNTPLLVISIIDFEWFNEHRNNYYHYNYDNYHSSIISYCWLQIVFEPLLALHVYVIPSHPNDLIDIIYWYTIIP